MKKHLLNLFAGATLAMGTMNANAQLPDGSYAPGWSLDDINGVNYDLDSLLDLGYTVYIDFSATWCGPCWNYHTGVTNGSGGDGALHKLWEDHGPAGQPGVSVSTTNDVWVFFIEGDAATTMSDLQGLTGASQGDWITGTPYPIINPSSGVTTAINNDYNIGYFPTVYAICPNRTITETGQATVTAQYAARNACSFSTGANDGGAHVPPTMNLNLMSCDSVNVSTDVINYGTAALTSADIEVRVDGILVKTVAWTGNVATYNHATTALGKVGALTTGNHTVQFTVTNPNGGSDVQASNDSDNSTFTLISATGSAAPVEGFTAVTYPPTGWSVINNGDAETWKRVTCTNADGASGGTSKLQFFDIPSGDIDELIVRGTNMTTVGSNPSLTFDVAYRPYNTSYYDNLKVFVSSDCGSTWTQVYNKSNTALATLAASSTAFTPSASTHWRKETVGLSAYASQANLLVKFQGNSGYGNNVYVDNVNIANNVGVTEVTDLTVDVNVYPNPSNGNFTVDVTTLTTEDVRIEVMNSLGQVVYTSTASKVHGQNIYNVDLSNAENGMYMVNVYTGKNITTQKITVLK